MNRDDKEDNTIYKVVVNPSAAEPQPKLAQRRKGRKGKNASELGVLGVLAGENGLRKKMEKQEDK
jgi:hypothetical protein